MGLEIQVKKGAYGKSTDPMRNFMKKLKSLESQRQYPARLKYFMDALYTVQDKGDPDNDTFRPLDEITLEDQVIEFMKHKDDLEWIKDAFFTMLDVHKRRVKAGKITDTTIFNYYKAAKKFCDANSIGTQSMWANILEEVPIGRKRSNDRKPNLEELRKLVSYHDKRIKAIVYTMISSGIRISSWDYLKWGDITPYYDNDDNKVICAKLRAYNIKKKNVNDGDKYYDTFITPEAYYELEKWINFRKAHGENVDRDSWVMRDLFESTKRNGNNVGNINNPKQLKSTGIKTMLERAGRSAKLFEPLKEGQKRREWKLAHGLRKYFKSKAEDVMKSLVVETLLAHDTHLGESYYRPEPNELRNEYLKAVPLLTIEEANLQKDKMKQEIREEVTKELESKYQLRDKEFRKEIILMKLNNCIMQELVPQARNKETFSGVHISAKEQYDYFMQTMAHKKSTKKEDLELLKEMMDNGEIDDYEEESYESIEYVDKFQDRFNEYKRLGKIDLDAGELGKTFTYYFDNNDNLIIEFDKKLKRDNFVLPPC